MKRGRGRPLFLWHHEPTNAGHARHIRPWVWQYGLAVVALAVSVVLFVELGRAARVDEPTDFDIAVHSWVVKQRPHWPGLTAFFRLATRFGFRLSPGTARALDQACGTGAFAEVGPGRWEAEITRLLREDRPARALRQAIAWGIWDALEGETVSGPALRRAALLAVDSEPAAASRRLGLLLATLALEGRAESARARLSRLASSGLVQSALDLAAEARSPRPGPRARRLASLARAAGVL